MKQNRGITLTGLSLYVLVLSIAIAVLSTITMYFSNNYEYIESEGVNASQYNRLMSYLIKDSKKDNITVEEIQDYILKLSNGITYSFNSDEKAVYRDEVRIADNIEECVFTQSTDGEFNNYFEVEVTIGIEKPLNNVTMIAMGNL